MICRTCGLDTKVLSKFIDLHDKEENELAELRAWKAKAMPFLDEALENFESYMYSQRLVAKGLTKENQETYAILTELIKGDK